MIENLTTPWYIDLGLIAGIFAISFLAISTYSSKKLNKIEKTKEKGGEKYQKYQRLKVFFMIGTIPFVILMFVSVFMTIFTGLHRLL